MDAIKITSIQSGIADHNSRLIWSYVASQAGIAVEFIGDLPWQQREEAFDAGEVQVCWMCSLPYIWKAGHKTPYVELLAAPVMRPPRYRNQPVYYSDVVVHRESRFQSFADLRGASWAYNEPHSHSGFNLTRYQLARLGETFNYFGDVIPSGAHDRSLQLIIERQIEASAIDSTVLELVLALRPDLENTIRIIDTWGPSPIPPWVIRTDLPPEVRNSIRQALLQMHSDPCGRQILDQGQIDHFIQVVDRDYDAVREMARIGASVPLPHLES
ncbi:MAG TPA: PhnD/SsuA/transferrin family substrate-binding protein [Anaerolineales bacterium]|jgi:phosphonate transport system substrate-binding protein|nr:PhnD/SsuA/transferrin family substrate-binding protein [Anaerolineales bacterium]